MWRHPKTCGFASSCIIILPCHFMFHSKQRNIFITVILFVPAKWLVLQIYSIYSFMQVMHVKCIHDLCTLLMSLFLKHFMFLHQ
jgi:hypothetical protein